MAKSKPKKPRVKWSLDADYVQACNCNAGCPCEFQAPPNLGYCEGLGAWKIRDGRYGALRLDGLAFGFAAHWPKAIHEGGGTMVAYFDERADPKQRTALVEIVSGAAGGLPFEILAQTMSKSLEPRFLPITFTGKGRERSVRFGDELVVETKPVVNPVNGAPESLKIDHATGFVFQKADVVLAPSMRVQSGELSFAWPGKGGFVSRVKYGN